MKNIIIIILALSPIFTLAQDRASVQVQGEEITLTTQTDTSTYKVLQVRYSGQSNGMAARVQWQEFSIEPPRYVSKVVYICQGDIIITLKDNQEILYMDPNGWKVYRKE